MANEKVTNYNCICADRAAGSKRVVYKDTQKITKLPQSVFAKGIGKTRQPQ